MKGFLLALAVIYAGLASCVPNVVKEESLDLVKEDVMGMEFVLVNGGCFEMGCGEWTGDCENNEKPLHKVCVDDFYMSKYEVTQSQWEYFMGNNPSYFYGHDKKPVETVTFDEVQGFIKKLNKRTGINYRLPTEAEWEYACRQGGEKISWSMDKTTALLSDYAWFVKNSDYETHVVGEKLPNALGIYDMNGNVGEFVLDSYDYNAYAFHKEKNPLNKKEGVDRIIRGGSFESFPKQLRCTNRLETSTDYKDNFFGFRIIRPIASKPVSTPTNVF